MALTSDQELSIRRFRISAVSLVAASLGYEFIAHEAAFFSGLGFCINAFWSGILALWSPVATEIGATASSMVLLSSVVIPVTAVTIYTVSRNAKEKPKALIIAISLFLNPLFIDFFKDDIGEEASAFQKLLLSAFGAVTFLVATYFWNKASDGGFKKSKVRLFIVRATAIVLFLLPLSFMAVYALSHAHTNAKTFIGDLNVLKVAGFIGLAVTACIGIGLSRYYDAP